MNKKGAVFAIMTVIFVFIFIFSNLIYKTHTENKLKIIDVGLGTLDLIKERNNFELNSFIAKKNIQYIVNQEFIVFLRDNKDSKDYSKFVELLKSKEEFKEDYNIKLEGMIIEFRKIKSKSEEIVFSDFIYKYKIDPNNELFVTSEGLKSLT